MHCAFSHRPWWPMLRSAVKVQLPGGFCKQNTSLLLFALISGVCICSPDASCFRNSVEMIEFSFVFTLSANVQEKNMILAGRFSGSGDCSWKFLVCYQVSAGVMALLQACLHQWRLDQRTLETQISFVWWNGKAVSISFWLTSDLLGTWYIAIHAYIAHIQAKRFCQNPTITIKVCEAVWHAVTRKLHRQVRPTAPVVGEASNSVRGEVDSPLKDKILNAIESETESPGSLALSFWDG